MWLRVDDGLLEHPKIIRAADHLGGSNALGRVAAVWLEAALYASRNLTDGFVPARVVARLLSDDEPARVAAALVLAGMWIEVPDGYRLHDWDHYQPSGADVKAKRARDRDRKRDQRSTGNNPQLVRADSARTSEGHPNGVRADSSALARARSRPDPLPRSKAEEPRALRAAPVSVFEVRPHLHAAAHATIERGGEFVTETGAPNIAELEAELKTIAARDLGATWTTTRELAAVVESVVARRRKRDEAEHARRNFEERERAAIRRLGGVR